MLCIEVGNSRTKWRLSQGELYLEGSYWNAECEAGYRGLSAVLKHNADSIWLASVAADSYVDPLVEDLRRDTGVKVDLVSVERDCLGFSVAYPTLSRLGVDRWLAMLAAWQDCRSACCVVDVGTATNVEFVSAAGEQIGGLIAPSSYAMMRALAADTHRVKPAVMTVPGRWAPQNDTLACVEHGIGALLTGLFQQVLERCETLGIRSLYLTGGGSGMFDGLYPSGAVDVQPRLSLVLDGLQLYANQQFENRE